MGEDDPKPTNSDDQNDKQTDDEPPPMGGFSSQDVARYYEGQRERDRDWGPAVEREERQQEAARQAARREASDRRAGFQREREDRRTRVEAKRDKERAEASVEAGRRGRKKTAAVITLFAGVVAGLVAVTAVLFDGGEDSTEGGGNEAVPAAESQTQEQSETPIDVEGEVAGDDDGAAAEPPLADEPLNLADALADFGPASGSVAFEGLDSTSQDFEAFFNLDLLTGGVGGQQIELLSAADSYVATLTRDIIDELMSEDFVLTQPRGDGSSQETIGRAASLTDGSYRLATVGGDESYLEWFVWNLSCVGSPSEPCKEVRIEGVNVGGPPETDIGRGFDDTYKLAVGGTALPEDRYYWSYRMLGSLSLDGTQPPEGDGGSEGDSPQPVVDSQISDVRSGVWQGEGFVLIGLKDLVDQSHEYMVEFGSNENDRIIGGFRPSDGFSTSLCIGETPSCLEGIFPIGGEIVGDNDAVVFLFELDAFDNSTGVRICASIKTEPDESPLPTGCEKQVELSDEEFDPFA